MAFDQKKAFHWFDFNICTALIAALMMKMSKKKNICKQDSLTEFCLMLIKLGIPEGCV